MKETGVRETVWNTGSGRFDGHGHQVIRCRDWVCRFRYHGQRGLSRAAATDQSRKHWTLRRQKADERTPLPWEAEEQNWKRSIDSPPRWARWPRKFLGIGFRGCGTREKGEGPADSWRLQFKPLAPLNLRAKVRTLQGLKRSGIKTRTWKRCPRGPTVGASSCIASPFEP